MSSKFPYLYSGLAQMGLDGCKRALRVCEETPQRVLTTGQIRGGIVSIPAV